MNDISHVQSIGVNSWINEQFNTSQTTLPNIPMQVPSGCFGDPAECVEAEFWQAALTAPDQLRHRVAFALTQQFVVSTNGADGRSVVPYYNTLAADAFSNWRTIMEDVTLTPAMGLYLNMIQASKPPAGQHANENFAREMMQLFSIGLVKLKNDGTPQLDSNGNTIPTYTQEQVQAFADVYTGWTYAKQDGSAPATFPNPTSNFYVPMVPVDSAHDTTQKTLLNGTVVPAGGTARGDLKIALDNIFNDPSLPPFVCRQLIQHLVTSAPSTGYVDRVTSVFINNGAGVRGDMKSVLTAILTDQEARAGDTNPSYDGGHLREPVLYLTSLMRGLGYTNTNTSSQFPYQTMRYYANMLNEIPMAANSVFNFFPPDYVIPDTNLNAPEFSLENTASVNQRLTVAQLFSLGTAQNYATDFSDKGTLGQLAAKDPGQLADALSVMLMHGQMPSNMRSTIVNALNQIAGITSPSQRVHTAVYLVLGSSLYKVMH